MEDYRDMAEIDAAERRYSAVEKQQYDEDEFGLSATFDRWFSDADISVESPTLVSDLNAMIEVLADNGKIINQRDMPKADIPDWIKNMSDAEYEEYRSWNED